MSSELENSTTLLREGKEISGRRKKKKKERKKRRKEKKKKKKRVGSYPSPSRMSA